MLKLIFVAILILLIFSSSNFVLAIADNSHEHICEDFSSGQLFGQHVSMHAREGHFNGEMNPGVHEGYSICVP